jgi:hypothetical protein
MTASCQRSAISCQPLAVSLRLDSIFETIDGGWGDWPHAGSSFALCGEEIDELLDGSISPVICGFDLGRRLDSVFGAVME